MAQARYAVAAAVVASLLLLALVYYRDVAVSSTMSWRMLVKVRRLQGRGGAGPAAGSAPDAAAQQRFAAVFASYLRRHEAAVALLDAPETRSDPEAAAGLRLVVVEPGPQVRAAPDPGRLAASSDGRRAAGSQEAR